MPPPCPPPCLLLFLLLLFSPTFSSPIGPQNLHREPRIIGGAPSFPFKYPWMVGLLRDPRSDTFPEVLNRCGGTLVSPNWVLTSARCSVGVRPGDAVAQVGVYYLLGVGDVTKIKVSRIEIHPQFAETDDPLEPPLYDVAMWKLAESVDIGADNLILLDHGNASLTAEGVPALMLGWGKGPEMEAGDYDIDSWYIENGYPTVLFQATYPISGPKRCTQAPCDFFPQHGCHSSDCDFSRPLAESQLCHVEIRNAVNTSDPVSFAFGDEGGPLLVDDGSRLIQVGVISSLVECIPYYPEKKKLSRQVFTRVASVREWIIAVQNNAVSLAPTFPFLLLGFSLYFIVL